MIESLLFFLKYFLMGAWAVIKGIAIGLWNEPLILTIIIIVLVGGFIARKLTRRH